MEVFCENKTIIDFHFLGDLIGFLFELKKNNNVRVDCDKDLANQRISINAVGIELDDLLALLVNSLSHSFEYNDLYVIEKRIDFSGKEYLFLKKTKKMRKIESLCLSENLEKIKSCLTLSRDIALGKVRRPNNLNGFLSGDIFADSVKGLRDSDIESLINGKSVIVKNVSSKLNENYKQYWSSVLGKQELFSPVIKKTLPPLYEGVSLRLEPNSGGSQKFTLQLRGAYTKPTSVEVYGILLDPMAFGERSLAPQTGNLPKEIEILPDKDVINLEKELFDSKVTKKDRSNPGFVLSLLSKKAKINFAAEYFLKKHQSGIEWEFTKRKGTLRSFATEIWFNWGILIQENKGQFIAWSPTYAFDRRADISDFDLRNWKEKLKSQKDLTLRKWIEIANIYNIYQINETLFRFLAIPYLDNLSEVTYEFLKFLGAMPSIYLQKAMEPEGILWQNIPISIRRQFNLSVVNQLNYEFPPVIINDYLYDKSEGVIEITKSINNKDIAKFTLNHPSGYRLFSVSVSGTAQ